MKKACIVTILLAVSFFLCGFVSDSQPAPIYFTIHINSRRIEVNDKILAPKWFNTEEYADFTKELTIYERAAEAASIEKDFPEIYQILKKIEREIKRKAFDGNINFDPNAKEKFWITGAQNGAEMDIEGAAQEILTALKNRTHADIIVKTKEIPHKSEKSVLSKIGMRAEYSTRFDSGNINRSKNIRRSAECFNGLCLLPGEVLSFNKSVGPRTGARGYEEAKIIVDGEFVPGVGGGVCQTSTTLFNAALLAGLSIAESHNHSLPISYVPLGRDAMVSSAADLKIKNNTGAPVYFEAGIKNGTHVFIKVYGNKLENIRYIPKAEVTPKKQETEVVGSIPADLTGFRKVVIEAGYPARSARTFVEVYNGERLVNERLIRKSNYKGKKEIIKYEPLPPQTVPIGLTNETELDTLGQ